MSDLVWDDYGGAGPPLVLVHGFTGSRREFAHVAGSLRDLRRILAVDQLGHGDSPQRERYSLRVLTNALIEFIRDQVGEPVDLLGHSMGGRTVLPIPIERPQLVRSLILMDTWADAVDRDHRTSELHEILDRPDDLALQALATYAEPRSPETDLVEERWGSEWVTTLDAHCRRVDPLAVVHLGREVFGESASLLADAARIDCPTTILVGEWDDPFLGPSERLAAQIPHANVVVIEGAYHSPQLTHPEEWVAAVRRHLEAATDA